MEHLILGLLHFSPMTGYALQQYIIGPYQKVVDEAAKK